MNRPAEAACASARTEKANPSALVPRTVWRNPPSVTIARAAKKIAAKADRPPNAASVQKRIRMRAAPPRPARGRSRGRRGAPVIALVVVPVIARVIVLVTVEVDTIQHHADRPRLSRA